MRRQTGCLPSAALFSLNGCWEPTVLASFPAAGQPPPDGLLAIGGDLQPERLLEAYRHGIFPWYNEGQPILWWSPDPRMGLYPDGLKISRSLGKRLRRRDYEGRVDR